MIEKTFKITPKLGLHARPASLFVQTSARFKSEIHVAKDQNGEEVVVNGKSVMGLMMLAAAHGEEVTVKADGPDAEKAIEAFDDLFQRKFDED